MIEAQKVLVSAALAGSVHVPSMSPYLPITPKEIGGHAIDAAQAGAAIPHLHARRPPDGRPAAEPEVFREFLPAVADATDAIINISTGGSTQMTIEQRLAAARSGFEL